MSTSPLYNFVVFAPDYTDEGAFERRMSVRPKHLEGAAALVAKGIVKVGGAMMSPESLNSPDKKFVGSTLILQVPSIEEARKIIESDIYWSSNVWDKEKTVILPYVAATPDSLKL